VVTSADKFMGAGSRISRGRWNTALASLAAQEVISQGFSQYYDAITPTGVDPLWVLAVFDHESSCGKNGIATITHSWGNMRNPPVGVPYHTYIDPRKGSYLSFANWLDGCLATANHAASDLYAGLTIAQAIHKWAPAGDNNDPEAYTNGVVAFMNRWGDLFGTGGNTMPTLPPQADIGFPVRWHAAADVGPDRPMSAIHWFIVHDTEGRPAGDEQVLTDPAAPVESAHGLILPDGTLVCMVPLNSTAWTPGNDAVAKASVNVELSGFATEPFTDQQYASLAAYFRWCVSQGMDVPAEYVGRDERPGIIGHQDVGDGAGGWGGSAHHTDPGPLFDWNRLVGEIGGKPAAPPAGPDFFQPDNPYGQIPVKVPFWNRWNALSDLGLALPMMGYAKEAERIVNGRRMQRFERGWYGTQDAPNPWDIVALFPEEWPQ
jgi:hypothetical protein